MTPREALIKEALRSANRTGSNWLRGKCPFCITRVGKPDYKGAFSFNHVYGFYHCFRCGVAGRLKGKEYLEPDDRALDANAAEGIPGVPKPENFVALASPDGKAMCVSPAWKYLATRGISAALVKEAQIGACATGQYAGRVIVPILGDDDTWLWWSGRAWMKKSDKPYMYPSGGRAQVLYNHKALTVQTDKPVYVVEGVFDTLALWPDSVALLGKPAGAQIEALALARRPVAIVLDGDAWEEGAMLALRLRFEGQRAGSVKLPPRLDPDEVPRDWLDAEALRSLD